MTKTTFASRLKQIRETTGFTQAEVARRAGLHVLGVAKLEQGLREPALSTAQAIAGALGVSLAVFDDVTFDRDAEPSEEPPAPKKRGRPKNPPA